MDNDNIGEIIGVLEDLVSLESDMLSDMQVHRLIDRAKEALRRYNQSTKIQGDAYGHSNSKPKNIHPSLFYSEDEWSDVLKEQQERFLRKWGMA